MTGAYTQVIVGNGGEQIEWPGGTWTLDGPALKLTSYRSAAGKSTEDVCWFFGQWETELVLLAKDDSQGDTVLLGLRAAVSTIA